MQVNRITDGLIDKNKKIKFSFNNKIFSGYEGDTLASALLANNQHLIGRSFKYHRPRGIFCCGVEEPNALVEIGHGAYKEPNTRATTTKLYDGLKANSQNHKGPLWFDFMAINDFFANFLSAGFYYKTFMWPKFFWEKVYEPIIRNSAGLGSLTNMADADSYDKGFRHCDILIIGSGASGLSAALAASKSAANIILADEDFILGGSLNSKINKINNILCYKWAQQAINTLTARSNVLLMANTTVFGVFDHGIYGAIENTSEDSRANPEKPRQINWRIYAKKVILCTGATERSIAFNNNDRPAIMLANSLRVYLNRFGVVTGKRISIYTNNDDGWQTASDLHKQGVNIVAVIDSRTIEPVINIEGVKVFMGTDVIDTKGRKALNCIKLSNAMVIKTDTLGVSGGFSPNIQLTCHHNHMPLYSSDIAAFVPGNVLPSGMSVAGRANGVMMLDRILQQGHTKGVIAASLLGFKVAESKPATTLGQTYNITPRWSVGNSGRAWVDLQNDVTVKDIKLANQEGFKSVEHVKRYTTLGMATDQGKTSNVLAIAIIADNLKQTIQQTGTTIFRPPYTPVAIGAFAGRSRGKYFKPTRFIPSYKWSCEQNADFVEVGMWLRSKMFALKSENHWRQTVDREVRQTRSSVGICDVTTLGKIDIKGSDSSLFLNRIYANAFAKVPVGKVRYGLMLREDGIAMDDGTAARLAEDHFVMTTTTANAVNVYRHLQFYHQCLWPELDLHLISVTEQYAQYSVAGPNSRKLLQKIVDSECDISNEAFPYMAAANITICGGISARLFRISFSGELAYEIAVPARYGDSLMRILIEAGRQFKAIAYGTESLGVMRIEKGHAAGPELNGRTTGFDLGMGRMIATNKDFIGHTLGQRRELINVKREQMVGLKPVNLKKQIFAGAHILNKGSAAITKNDQGWISSCVYSPTLEHYIALAFIKSGRARTGEIVRAVDLTKNSDVEVEIVSPHFFDPKGERLRV